MRAPAHIQRSTSSTSITSSSSKRTSPSSPLHRRASAPAALPSPASAAQTVDSGLAICLFGVGASSKMYDSEFEEDRRRRVVMAEVLPDAEMWRKWEKNEAPLRQGRGWYPALDRHFLELLVISEIACLSHPLNAGGTPGTAERIHRHAIRVRRVACDRIGQERLGAYCDRVKEAFDAYVQGPGRRGWGVPKRSPEREREAAEHAYVSGAEVGRGEDEEDGEGGEEEERGRRLVREGSREREESPEGMSERGAREHDVNEEGMEADPAETPAEMDPEGATAIDPFADPFMDIDLALPSVLLPSLDTSGEHENEGDGDIADEAIPDLSPSRSDSDDAESMAGSVWGLGNAGEGAIGVRIELDDVDETDEEDAGREVGADIEMGGEEVEKMGKRVVASGISVTQFPAA